MLLYQPVKSNQKSVSSKSKLLFQPTKSSINVAKNTKQTTKKQSKAENVRNTVMNLLSEFGPKQAVRVGGQIANIVGKATGQKQIAPVPEPTTKQVAGDVGFLVSLGLPISKAFSLASKLGKVGAPAARILGAQGIGAGFSALGAMSENKPVTKKTAATGIIAGTAIGAGGELLRAGLSKLGQKMATKATLEQKVKTALNNKVSPEIQNKPYIQKFKEIKPTIKKYIQNQKALYSAERGKRFGAVKAIGEKEPTIEGFYKQKAAMSGVLPRAKVKPITGFTDADIQAMMRDITTHPTITEGEQLAGKQALLDFFRPETGLPKIHGESGLKVLEMVYGEDFVKEMSSAAPYIRKALEAGYQIGNLPRSMMSSVDFSASFRQLFAMGVRHPITFAKNFPKQFKFFFSQKSFENSIQRIRSKPYFKVMNDIGKVQLTEVGSHISQAEERFASPWADKLPWVKASNRAYTGLINEMRSDVFGSLYKNYISFTKGDTNPEVIRQIGKLVNATSGRGELPEALRGASNALNAFFYSPKLIASRLQIMNYFNPVKYIKADPFIRREMLKTVGSMVGFSATTLGLAKAAGAEVETDPRSSDFLKIKLGNTRIDILGGLGQYMVLGGRMVAGSYKNSATGKITKFSGAFGKSSYADFFTRFFEYKEAPLVSFISTLAKQKPIFDNINIGADIAEKIGFKIKKNEVSIPTEVINRFIPMVAQDSYDLYKEDGVEMLPLSILAIFGFGLQTYK